MKRSQKLLARFAGAAAVLGSLVGPSFGQSKESAAQCGPPVYCAPSDRVLRKESPLSIGDAGSVFDDPDFGSRIVRVTDANTATQLGGGFPGVSFATDSSSEQNTWNKSATRFYAVTEGGRAVLFGFDPESKNSWLVRISGGGWLPLRPGASFSFVDPDVIYGSPASGDSAVARYRLSTRKTSTVFDARRCVPHFGRVTTLGDISVSSNDQQFATYAGGPIQDEHMLVMVFDSTQGCRWYNTQTGQVGGDWGPAGAATTPQKYLIHNARLSKRGDFVRITGPGGGVEAYWQVATLNVTTCSSRAAPYCGGHKVLGYAHMVNQPGTLDDMNVVMRPLTSIKASFQLINPLLTPTQWTLDSHWSWNNDDANDSFPVCGSTYREVPPFTRIERAWDREVICIRTDGTQSQVWRFAHHRSTAANGFWSTPRGNVSQDGKFYMFTSDWENTLGFLNGSRTQHRTDVFVVELK